MKICWLWCELKLLLVDITRSVRLSEEVTRVSQHFGVLTISFSRRDVLLAAGSICVVLAAADQQARFCKSMEKRRRLIK
ncbi:hypothetical protein F511_45533 [Dorcoceras hygrometricum]|uniref:Secreted protein n=1 Tax=Dorcoceras hygrometricum TaxID=472368 RepID=A0A2Z6ZVR8_9LAMI|nr:hypothetical protein F511_45533 [Dorcoceras hygrometricum]